MNVHRKQPQVISNENANKSNKVQIREPEDIEEEDEVQYMLMGKQQNQMREFMIKKMEERTKQRVLEKRQQKLNVMLIENFAKKELQFMNKYKKNSNVAIDNGDHRRVDTFQMSSDDKRTIVAGQWKMPASEMNHLKNTQGPIGSI